MKRAMALQRNQKWAAIVLTSVLVVVGVYLLIFAKAATPPTPAAGSGASLSLSPASGSYQSGASFTVDLYEDSGVQEVNAVDIGLSYDSTKLQYISASTSSSSFTPAAAPAASGGTLVITSYVNPGTISSGNVTGKQQVASITFKALAASGSPTISFVNNSTAPPRSAVYLYKVGTNLWDGNTAGGTYTLTAVSGGGSGGTGAGSGGGSTGSTGSTGGSGSSAGKATGTTNKNTGSSVVQTPGGSSLATPDTSGGSKSLVTNPVAASSATNSKGFAIHGMLIYVYIGVGVGGLIVLSIVGRNFMSRRRFMSSHGLSGSTGTAYVGGKNMPEASAPTISQTPLATPPAAVAPAPSVGTPLPPANTPGPDNIIRPTQTPTP